MSVRRMIATDFVRSFLLLSCACVFVCVCVCVCVWLACRCAALNLRSHNPSGTGSLSDGCLEVQVVRAVNAPRAAAAYVPNIPYVTYHAAHTHAHGGVHNTALPYYQQFKLQSQHVCVCVVMYVPGDGLGRPSK
jgi:hypothetical protein